ncbi:MAG TPA: VOC family protein [Candidatus Saccharimonadales bacterium]|nr:VOC family protein [Candidatus Saccharimonadales bacterium]
MNNPTVISSVVYNDAPRGIAWLIEVLGLKLGSLYKAPDGTVAFAELVWRTGVVFVSGRPPADNPWFRVGIASIALVAENAEAVTRQYHHAVAAGAEVVREIHVARTPAFPEGSTQFDLRDTEGNLWTVGTFQPIIKR